MKHSVLDQHQKIAWDMDMTLVGGHRNNHFFLNYIAAHPEKEHYIVTFRDTLWAGKVLDELEMAGLDPTLIKDVHNLPDRIYLLNELMFAPDAVLKRYGATREEVNNSGKAFARFKGSKAKELGCTVLVDDLPDAVMLGCQEHGIVFLHSHDPIEGY